MAGIPQASWGEYIVWLDLQFLWNLAAFHSVNRPGMEATNVTLLIRKGRHRVTIGVIVSGRVTFGPPGWVG